MDPMDLPGLSYVTAAAETTLRMLAPQGVAADAMNRVANAPNEGLGVKLGTGASPLYQKRAPACGPTA